MCTCLHVYQRIVINKPITSRLCRRAVPCRAVWGQQALRLYERAGELGSTEAWRNLASECVPA